MGAVCRPAGREVQWSTVPPAILHIGVDAIGGKRAVLFVPLLSSWTPRHKSRHGRAKLGG